MYYGTLILLGNTKDVENAQYLIETDSSVLEDEVQDFESPSKFRLRDERGIIYRVVFNDDQWLDINEMSKTFEKQGIECDIVHCSTNGSFVDVVSTSGDYDDFSEDPYEILDLQELYGFEENQEAEVEFED